MEQLGFGQSTQQRSHTDYIYSIFFVSIFSIFFFFSQTKRTLKSSIRSKSLSIGFDWMHTEGESSVFRHYYIISSIEMKTYSESEIETDIH